MKNTYNTLGVLTLSIYAYFCFDTYIVSSTHRLIRTAHQTEYPSPTWILIALTLFALGYLVQLTEGTKLEGDSEKSKSKDGKKIEPTI